MKPDNHIKIPRKKLGVLMVNLGTPEKTDFINMWKYLREFLSDRRIIELTRLIWYPILYGIILMVRPGKSGKLYKSIWDKKNDESPLKVFTRNVSEKLQKKYKKEKIEFSFAMNYGFPQIGNELKKLKSKGCEKILIFPMYPQYSATTTASVIDNVNRYLTKERWQPTLRFVPPYYDDEIYIDAIYKHIKKNLKQKKLKTKKNSLFISWDTKKVFLQGRSISLSLCKNSQIT